MDLYTLKPGDQVHTIDGDTAEVVRPTEDGQWIQVRYLASPRGPELVGTLDLCHVGELETVIATTDHA